MNHKGLLYDVAEESIKFQDGKAFEALTNAYADVRQKYKKQIVARQQKTILHQEYYFNDNHKDNDEVFIQIVNVIKHYFGITIDILQPGAFATYLPLLNNNNILMSDRIKEHLEMFGVDRAGDIKKVMSTLDSKVIDGTVNLATSKVAGAFSKIKVHMYINLYDMCINPEIGVLTELPNALTDAELAAVTLHEIGHIFTGMEYIDRTMTNNQVLATTSVLLNNNHITPDEKKIVFSKSIKLIGATEKYVEDLEKAKTNVEIAVIYLDATIEQSKSQLGASIYDNIACEQLADDFAVRHGAGKELVTALTKYIGTGLTIESKVLQSLPLVIMAIYGSLGGIAGAIIVPLIFLITYSLVNSKDTNEYDNYYSRFNRIKNTLVAQLKELNIDNEEMKFILEKIENIEHSMSHYKDQLGIYDGLSYYLKPSFRRAHNYEQLQKKLENLAANDLFIAAAKLKTV